MYFADLDGDGRDDLISKEYGVLYTFHNGGYTADGRVSWGAKTDFAWGFDGSNGSVYFSDYDGDGRADLVSKEYGVLYGYHNFGMNGDGTVSWGAKTAIASGFGSVSDGAVYVL